MKIQKVVAVKILCDDSDVQSKVKEVNNLLEQGWRLKDINSTQFQAGEGYRSRILSYFILEKNSENEK